MAAKSRPLHFYVDMSGETLCGKATWRVRSTSNLSNWDSPAIAGGKRCPTCAGGIPDIRKKTGKG